MEKEKEKELKDKTASSQKISANGSELKEDSKFDNSEEDKNLLLKEIEEINDRLLRAQAEVQNVRRVAAQEVTKARLFGVESLAKEFLSVGDNIQRALDSCNDESNMSSVKEGLELVLKTFESSLETAGVHPIDPMGETFDADKHEAISVIEDNSKEENTVVEVIQRGFTIQERILRPSGVIVSKKSKKNK